MYLMFYISDDCLCCSWLWYLGRWCNGYVSAHLWTDIVSITNLDKFKSTQLCFPCFPVHFEDRLDRYKDFTEFYWVIVLQIIGQGLIYKYRISILKVKNFVSFFK